MTRFETAVTVCDIDGAGATPVPFSIDGQHFEADLCAAHKALMAAGLHPYLLAGRPAASPARRQKLRSDADRERAAAIRAWAIEHAAEYGWEVGARGRIPAEVYPAYEAAHGGAR